MVRVRDSYGVEVEAGQDHAVIDASPSLSTRCRTIDVRNAFVIASCQLCIDRMLHSP